MLYQIEVPGTFAADRAFLDLETVKVPADYRMANGEMLRRRWSIAMAGIALEGKIDLFDSEGDERYVLEAIADALAPVDEVVYGATREFDEMICKGRFTNARRAHAPAPVFPAVPWADELRWTNIGAAKPDAYRSPDVESRDVPKILETDRTRVLVHLLRDVAELILVAGSPDAIARKWCEDVLVSWGFALVALREAGV